MFMRFWLGSTVPGAYNRLTLSEQYAIMETVPHELVTYNPAVFAAKPFRLIYLHNFRARVAHHFPNQDQADLTQWYEMKRARAANKLSAASSGAG